MGPRTLYCLLSWCPEGCLSYNGVTHISFIKQMVWKPHHVSDTEHVTVRKREKEAGKMRDRYKDGQMGGRRLAGWAMDGGWGWKEG